MPVKKGSTRVYFPQVKVAREALRDRANEILEAYIALSAEAKAAGDFEVASDILWKLIEHMPHEDGERLIDSSASKPKEIEGKQGPTIQIGLVLGGVSSKKELPETPIIDIGVDKEPEGT